MTNARISSGITGLDDVLHGGLIAGRSYLVHGLPGTGKTILACHFLTAEIDDDESVLYVNLEESTEEIRANAEAVGIDLSGVEFLDFTPDADAFTNDQSYSVFTASEVDGDSILTAIAARIEELQPTRVVVDPVTQLQHLSPDEYQFRKQVLGLGQLLGQWDATVLFTSQAARAETDDLQFVVDGTIELELASAGRTLTVPKFRGSGTLSGEHSVRIDDAGLHVFPELRPDEYRREFTSERISSGIPALDELLHGGLENGTISVISGPSGTGKTTTGTQFMKEAAGRGKRSVVYLFEENYETFLTRSEAVNIPVERMVERGTLSVQEMEPLDVSPQEFAAMVRREVEEADAEIVMIDGIQGYKLALQGDDDQLVRRLHALGRYLKNMGVTVIFVDEVGHVTGEFQPTEAGISYLADNIIFLRHVELGGQLRKVIGVLKKRTSEFEHTLRELEITEHGIKVGDPLTNLRGLLTGTPELVDPQGEQGT